MVERQVQIFPKHRCGLPSRRDESSPETSLRPLFDELITFYAHAVTSPRKLVADPHLRRCVGGYPAKHTHFAWNLGGNHLPALLNIYILQDIQRRKVAYIAPDHSFTRGPWIEGWRKNDQLFYREAYG